MIARTTDRYELLQMLTRANIQFSGQGQAYHDKFGAVSMITVGPAEFFFDTTGDLIDVMSAPPSSSIPVMKGPQHY